MTYGACDRRCVVAVPGAGRVRPRGEPRKTTNQACAAERGREVAVAPGDRAENRPHALVATPGLE